MAVTGAFYLSTAMEAISIWPSLIGAKPTVSLSLRTHLIQHIGYSRSILAYSHLSLRSIPQNSIASFTTVKG